MSEVRRHRQHVETAEVERSHLVEAVSQVDELVMITGVSGAIEYVNPAFEKITGYTTAESVGVNPKLLRREMTPAETYEELWSTLQSGKTWRGRLVNTRKDGEMFVLESVISPIRGNGGEVVGYVGLGRDVTSERELEAQLRQTQKLQALGQLTSGVAHDFNNTLAVIMTVAGVVRQELDPAHLSLRADLDEIIDAARRAEGVVARLLGFSRKADLRLKPVSLTQLCTGMSGMIRATLPTTIRFSAHLDEGAPRVLAASNAVEQVILNLVTNARDAMPDGGELQISVEPVSVDEVFCAEHEAAQPGPHVCVTIADTGGGIDPEIADQIFTPFFTTKPEGKGTGESPRLLRRLV